MSEPTVTINERSFVLPHFYPLLMNKARHLVEWGGAGSGKSHSAAQKLILRVIYGLDCKPKNRKRLKFYCVRKTQPAVRRSCWPLVNDYITKWELGKFINGINLTDMTIRFEGGSSINFMGLDDPEKIKSIEGVSGTWVEEPTEIKREDYHQLNIRMRGDQGTYFQNILTFNPISKGSWLYETFFEQGMKNQYLHHSTVDDNTFIVLHDPGYIEELDELAEHDPLYHTVYRRGEWGVLRGLVYENWDEVDNMPLVAPDEWWFTDYGFNVPSILGHSMLNERDLYLDELIYERKLDNAQFTEKMLALIPRDKGTVIVYCDSSEPDRIAESNAMARGMNHPAYFMAAVKEVFTGIDLVKRLRLHFTKRSINAIKEVQSYAWMIDKNGKPMDVPVKFMDHFMDGIRMGYHTRHGKSGEALTQQDFKHAY